VDRGVLPGSFASVCTFLHATIAGHFISGLIPLRNMNSMRRFTQYKPGIGYVLEMRRNR
jgi:hypothetical protein